MSIFFIGRRILYSKWKFISKFIFVVKFEQLYAHKMKNIIQFCLMVDFPCKNIILYLFCIISVYLSCTISIYLSSEGVEQCIPWAENTTQQIDLAFNIFFMVYFFIRVSLSFFIVAKLLYKCLCLSIGLIDLLDLTRLKKWT